MAVAFDAATDAQEVAGDGVLSLSHTASGSDRAAFAVAAARAAFPASSTSITYAGTAMTEMWDITQDPVVNAGYRLAGASVTTGAQTVTSTLSTGGTDDHFLGVITMTGVDGTTPVGTAQTTTGTGTGTATVTVAGVNANDLVVDGFLGEGGGAGLSVTIGADQTQRNTESVAGAPSEFRMSSQPGTAGGVMSWSLTGALSSWTLGANVFKEAAAAGGGRVRPSSLARLGVQ